MHKTVHNTSFAISLKKSAVSLFPLARRQNLQLDRYVSVATDKAPELAMRPSFLSTFGMATDQGGKLGLGKNKAIICMYSTYQVHSNLTYKYTVWMCVFLTCIIIVSSSFSQS